jgi:hypothetical protein
MDLLEHLVDVRRVGLLSGLLALGSGVLGLLFSSLGWRFAGGFLGCNFFGGPF